MKEELKEFDNNLKKLYRVLKDIDNLSNGIEGKYKG